MPDNIGPNGIIGENRNGQWWGGLYGWNSTYAEDINFGGLTVAAEIAVNAPLADSTNRWSSQVLADPDRYCTQTTLAPRRVPSLAAVRKARGRNWIFSVSGGIAIEPPPVQLQSFGTLDRQLAARIRRIQDKPHPNDNSWWWD